MPVRRGAARDPRQELARIVNRLSQRRQSVTFMDIERATARQPSRLAIDGLSDVVEGAVAESILLKDRRTFFERTSGTFSEQWVYRVNPRHPLVAEIL